MRIEFMDLKYKGKNRNRPNELVKKNDVLLIKSVLTEWWSETSNGK